MSKKSRSNPLTPADNVQAYSSLRELANAAEILKKYLSRAKEQDLPNIHWTEQQISRHEKLLIHPHIADSLADTLTSLTRSLNTYAHCHRATMRKYLTQRERWPAVMSIVGSEDVRGAIMKSNSTSKKFHKEAFGHLGENLPFRPSHAKSFEIFHHLASEFATEFIERRKFISQYRHARLPWFFDYYSKSNSLIEFEPNLESIPNPLLDENTNYSRMKNQENFILAFRYFISLTLAPQETRNVLHRNWRNLRQAIFKIIKLSSAEEEALRDELTTTPPDPRGEFIPQDSEGNIRFPDIFCNGLTDRPTIKDWWELNLQFSPDCYFGENLSLDSWPNHQIEKNKSTYRKAAKTTTTGEFNSLVTRIVKTLKTDSTWTKKTEVSNMAEKGFSDRLYTIEECESLATKYCEQNR